MRVVAHLSDLHFGRIRAELLTPLLDSVHAARPDLVVISGDLTQRARASQFADAQRFLAALPQPVLVVPGNHDVPLDAAWIRLLSPWRRYRRWISRELEPRYEDAELVVAGINTAAPFTWQRGWITSRAVTRACGVLGRVQGRVRLVVTHHPFVHAPQFVDKALMRGAGRAIRGLAECGTDILLSGHLHDARAEVHRVLTPNGRAVLLVQAGTGLSSRIRGMGNDYNLLRIQGNAVRISRFATPADQAAFRCVAETRFARRDDGWGHAGEPVAAEEPAASQ